MLGFDTSAGFKDSQIAKCAFPKPNRSAHVCRSESSGHQQIVSSMYCITVSLEQEVKECVMAALSHNQIGKCYCNITSYKL